MKRREVGPDNDTPDSRKPVSKSGTPPEYSMGVVPASCPDAESRRADARAILAPLLAREAMKRRDGKTRRTGA